MKKISIGLILLILFSTSIIAQNNSTIMTIGDDKISTEEFLRLYHKNNPSNKALNQKEFDEYLPLFTNFKLKVKEAKSLGYDTLRNYKLELNNYREQLALPYLTDEETEQKILKEAYERGKYDLRASQILLTLPSDATPADTLEIYNKAMEIRKMYLKGKNFADLAKEFSDDPSARDQTHQGIKIKGNGGDLGYFTVFNMIYSFETMAYNMKVGDISYPIRSNYGYHLIKLTDKKPALGKIQLAHIICIMDTTNPGKTKEKIDRAYNLLNNGLTFSEIAKNYSDDKTTKDQDGLLPWYPVTRILPQYVENAQKLEINEYSKPFESAVGWHIIKKIDNNSLGSYEEELDDFRKKVAQNDRMKVINDAFINNNKKLYNFTKNTAAIDEIIPTVTDSIFFAKWDKENAKGLNKTVFSIGDKTFNQQDFANMLATSQRVSIIKYIPEYVYDKFNEWTDIEIRKYANSKLEEKYPDFNNLMQEYRDGILLFNITDKKIWTKAIEDTLGLENFYQTVKNNYMWEPRLKTNIYTVQNLELANKIKKNLKNGLTYDEILRKNNIDSTQISLQELTFSSDEYPEYSNIKFEKGVYVVAPVKNNKYHIVDVLETLPKQPKQLNEIRGIIISEYQDYLEEEWIKELHKKYPVMINKVAVSNIIK